MPIRSRAAPARAKPSTDQTRSPVLAGNSPASSGRGRSGDGVCCEQSGGQPKGSLRRRSYLRAVRRAATKGALGRRISLQTVRRSAGGVAWQTGFAASSPATRCLLLHSTVRHPSESPCVDSTHRIRTARIVEDSNRLGSPGTSSASTLIEWKKLPPTRT